MFDAVSCTIPGAKNSQQAAENARAADLTPLSAETMAAVRDIYKTMIKKSVHQRW
jgi:aryl-alcohol dehydrogenase-like predicted oxidoreductase